MKSLQERKLEFHTLFISVRNGIAPKDSDEQNFERATKYWRAYGMVPLYDSFAEFAAEPVPQLDPSNPSSGSYRPTGFGLQQAKWDFQSEVKHKARRDGLTIEEAFYVISYLRPGIYNSYQEFADEFDVGHYQKMERQAFTRFVHDTRIGRRLTEEEAFNLVAKERPHAFTDYEQFKRLQNVN